jgi:hypothetical protein
VGGEGKGLDKSFSEEKLFLRGCFSWTHKGLRVFRKKTKWISLITIRIAVLHPVPSR